MEWPVEINNDAAVLRHRGIKSPDTDASYAKAWNAGMKLWKFFATRERFEIFRKNCTNLSEWKIIILNEDI